MTIFSTPRLQREDMGAHEFGTSLGDVIGASASEAVHEMPTVQLKDIAELQTAKGERDDLGSAIARVQGGEDPADVMATPAKPARVPMTEAKAKVKDAGLDKALTLPDGEDMSGPALDIMMERARGRQERAATIARGPSGIIPTALSVGTSFAVGALDPVNVAAAFIPVVGEARYAKLLADAAGTLPASMGERLAARAGIGAASGAVGMAAIEPIAAYAKTQEGQDYTFAHALRSVIFGAFLGGALHTGGGAIADVLRSRGGRPLYPFDAGEPLEFHTPWDELKLPPAGAPRGLPVAVPEAEPPGRPPVSQTEQAAAPVSPEGDLAAREAPPQAVPSPAVAVIDDLPPRAREDAMRGAVAALVQGEPVRVGEMIEAGARADPRIAESVEAGRTHAVTGAADFSEPGKAVFADMRQQLIGQGIGPDIAEANAAVFAARYEARAARLEGAGGTAEDLYRAEGIQVRRNSLDDELAADIGRVYLQGQLNEGQLDLFRMAAKKLPAPEPPRNAEIPFEQTELGRSHAELYAGGAARFTTSHVAGGPVARVSQPRVVELLRSGASDAEITAELARWRAQLEEARSGEKWHASFGQQKVGAEISGASPEYQRAYAAHNEALAAFNQVRDDYRARRVGDDVFRAAQDKMQQANAAFDEAFAREQARPPTSETVQLDKGTGEQLILPGAERIGQGELAQRKADEALKPKKAQKPMDFGLFGDDAAQKSFFQPPTVPTFYSAVERAVGNVKMEKASPDQWLATIRNTPGVKAEELEWLGVGDWLKDQDGPVTRAQLQDYVRANAIEVKEVAKGVKDVDAKARLNEINDRLEEIQDAFDMLHGEPDSAALAERRADLAREKRQLHDELAELWKGERAGGAPKFSSYTLPGGENYRELLLTLPAARGEKAAGNAAADYAKSLREKYGERYITQAAPDELREYNRLLGDQHDIAARGKYQSAHWDEPNILAHVRFNDRTIDGKRALFIEEVQSDWHQAGKRRGYQGEIADITPLMEKAAEARMARTRAVMDAWRRLTDGKATSLREAGDHGYGIETVKEFQKWRDGPEYERLNAEAESAAEALEHARRQQASRVPDAPFKTTWPELSLKRMIRYAAENGYDKIAWTPGTTQAERYNLRKHVERISYVNDDYLSAWDKHGEKVITKAGVKPDDLADYIGKEAATKLLARPANEIKIIPALTWLRELTVTQSEHQYHVKAPDGRSVDIGKGTVHDEHDAREYGFRYLNKSAEEINQRRQLAGEQAGPTRELKGLELEVGGEGMKGFYDKILPATVNKLTKKFGGKVEDADLHDTGRGRQEYDGRIPNDDEMDKVWNAASSPPTRRVMESPITGQPLMFQLNRVAVTQPLDDVMHAMRVGGDTFREAMGSHGTPELAEIFGGDMKVAREARSERVHTLDITPDLRRAAVEQGFPLFQGGERGRITLADGRAIIDLFKSADRSTLMHEAGHLWLDELARDAARVNAPAGIREDMASVLKWLGAERPDAITTEQHEKWAQGFEQYLASGQAPTPALKSAFQKFKDWLTAIYKSITAIGEPIPDEIRAVIDRMIATPEQLGEHAAPAADAVVKMPARRGPAARDPNTFSLLEFIASRGGLRNDDPLIGDVRGSIGRNNRAVPGFGSLIRQPLELSTAARMGGRHAPMTLDQAREAAIEAGYLRDNGADAGRESTTDVRTLLDAIDRELRGQKVYREGHERADRVDADQEAHYAEQHAQAIAELRERFTAEGIDPKTAPDATLARVLEIMRREGESDPLNAYERALMEEVHDASEAGELQRTPDHIPGWDVPPDAGPAPAAGGPGAGGGQGRTGGPAREPGGGDRAAAERDTWSRLADSPRDFDEPDVVAASKRAEALPEPESAQPSKRLQAAQKAEAEAQAAYESALAYLPADVRNQVEQDLRRIDQDALDTTEVLRSGAACLAAGVAEAVA